MVSKVKSAIIIGSTKIAQIHYNFIRENSFKKFFFVGRNKKKIDTFIKKNKINNGSFLEKKFLKNTKKTISICSKTDFHQDYLNYINSTNQLVIVEKPLISIKIFKKQYLKQIKFYYKKIKKLIVVYPMIYLAQAYNGYFKINKITNFKIYYFTKGENTYDDIYIDLLPHCLIFFKELCRLKKKNIGPLIKVNKKKITKYANNIQLTFKDIKLTIFLKEKYKGKNSKFFFKINNNNYYRVTKLINGNFKNYIKNNNKLVEIQNPMRQFFLNTIKNLNKNNYFNENKKVSLWLSKLTYKIFYT